MTIRTWTSRTLSTTRMLVVLCVGLLAIGCTKTMSPSQIQAANDYKLFEQMRWVDRGPDSVFKSESRDAYVESIRREILERRPGWPDDVVRAIHENRVELGMTMPQVVASIGWPREYPWWDVQWRPIGMDGDDFGYWSALQNAKQWTYGHGDTSLRVWFRDGEVYRIMDQATGRIEPAE